MWREELRNCCLWWEELKHASLHYPFGWSLCLGRLAVFLCASERRNNALGLLRWNFVGLLFRVARWFKWGMTQLHYLGISVDTDLLGWLGGSLMVKLHYLVGEVHNNLIAGVIGRLFNNGETALPCWWMKTYLLGCSLGSEQEESRYCTTFSVNFTRLTYWVAVFGVTRLLFRAEGPKHCTTSLNEFHKHFLAGLLFWVATGRTRKLDYLFGWISRRFTWLASCSFRCRWTALWGGDSWNEGTTLPFRVNYTKTYMMACSFSIVGNSLGWRLNEETALPFVMNYTKTYMTACSFAVVGRPFRVATGGMKKLHYLAKEVHEDLLARLVGWRQEESRDRTTLLMKVVETCLLGCSLWLWEKEDPTLLCLSSRVL